MATPPSSECQTPARTRLPGRVPAVFAALAWLGAVAGRGQTLFSPPAGGGPGTQGWSYVTTTGTARQDATASHVELATGPSPGEIAGWGRTAPAPLERIPGFQLHFRLQIVSETHTREDRAGFSLVVVSRDLRAIELGFWTHRIWAQGDNPLFVQAEGVEADTSTAPVDYHLTFAGDRYLLASDEGPLLGGPLRDYTAFVGLLDPYETPDFLFLGDDTGSASATARVGEIRLTRLGRPKLSVRGLPGGIRLEWEGGPEWRLESAEAGGSLTEWHPVAVVPEPPDGGPARRIDLASDAAARLFRLRWEESGGGAGPAGTPSRGSR